MKRIWKAKPKIEGDLLRQLLANRGLVSDEEIQTFLDPRYEQSHDPFLMADMEKAVGRVLDALEKQEQITVYADYDADGVTAAAVFLRFFEHIKYPKVDYYIPDRFEESYGMNMEAVEMLAQKGTKLLITVDCGINAFDSALKARERRVDLIITDHHQLTGGLPEAVAVLNPHRPDDRYPFKDLTGVGVAFKLAQGIIQKIKNHPPRRTKFKVLGGWEKWLLDLVAIGTVADCQSLLGENRIFVKWGLQVLQKTRWPGLRQLMIIAGVAGQPLDSYVIGFVIAPRINAAGRIEHANLALEMLLLDSPAEAEKYAARLEELNRHRQDLTAQILSEAREQILAMGDQKILLAAGENWPKGIVGLVAGKLTEEFARPVLVMQSEDQEATGSARSIPGLNIVEAIGQSREILVKYGGHPMAAGFTLRREHIALFHKNLLAYADKTLTAEALAPVIFYDAEISLADVNSALLELLGKFAPFGIGNPRPRLRLNHLALRAATAIGRDGKHLRLVVEQKGQALPGVGFNQGFWADRLARAAAIDIICEPQYNEWNGETTIQLKILDLKISDE